MADGIHSTGRGGMLFHSISCWRSQAKISIGAGNIGRDDTLYTDGNIIREGFVGESSKPEYSSGRGGAGNIVDSPRVRPVGDKTPVSEDIIPEPAMRNSAGHDNFHTGRGGEGNVYKEKYGGHSTPQEKKEEKPHEKESLGDKVKHLFGKKD
ncbi:hypothetical protein E4T43_05013 [Aureobasidium subglaciale]|nr:hypothetical protein E4T43_05013 [Aureobasidium subglaciale]